MHFIALPQSFYEASAEVVAPRLLGHWLIRQTAEGFCGGPIVETEAYLVDDPASHAFSRQTARNRVMFGPPGFAYVYFIYGAHCCVNAVCRPEGHAEAVLIRAIEAEFGQPLMQQNRPVPTRLALTSGPGKLCAALQIDRTLNGAALYEASSPLMIAQNPDVKTFCSKRGPIRTSGRIGITKAADLPLRFYLEKSAFVLNKKV